MRMSEIHLIFYICEDNFTSKQHMNAHIKYIKEAPKELLDSEFKIQVTRGVQNIQPCV